MNKRGFTLIELLAAITILALLALVTVPAVTRPVKESKEDLYKSQLRSFKASAKAWGAEKMFSALPEKNECMLLPLTTLVNDGLVDPNVQNPLDGGKFVTNEGGALTTNVYIKIYHEYNTSGSSPIDRLIYTVYDCSGLTCTNPDDEDDSAVLGNLRQECSVYGE